MLKKKKTNPPATLDQINYLMEENNKSLIEQLDKRFQQIDQRFESIDRKFEQVDQRFDQVDQRFDSVDKRFDEIYDAIQEATGNVYDLINKEFKPRIEKLENRAFAGV